MPSTAPPLVAGSASPSLLVVAGEASGDRLAAAAVAALRALRPDLRFFGMGGDLLGGQGVELLHQAREVAVMGLSEVVLQLPRLARLVGGLARAAAIRRPAAALLVDLPDFNLPLARRLTGLGIPVFFYVSPTVWAWRQSRTVLLARDTHQVLCIYPFEERFLRRRGVNARYVGNPLLDPLPSASGLLPPLPVVSGQRRLAVLPGSRPAELRRLLAPMLGAVERLAQGGPLAVALPVAATLGPPARAMLARAVADSAVPIHCFEGPGATQQALAWAELALVKSGTVTLEALLADVPMVVAYRVSALTAALARPLIGVRHISLPNLLSGRPLVPELLQRQATAERLAMALGEVWRDRQRLLAGYAEVRAQLGGPGASRRVAEAILAGADLPEPIRG